MEHNNTSNNVLGTDISETLEYIAVEDMSTPYLLQSKDWAGIKEQFGWEPFAIRQSIFPHLESDIMILIRKISRLGYLAYIPDGILSLAIIDIADEPQNQQTDKQVATYLEKNIRDALSLIACINMSLITKKGRDVFCVRWDMPWICQKQTAQNIADYPSIQSLLSLYTHYRDDDKSVSLHIPTQPPSTIMLDLKKSEETLLSEMKSKTRYNIKLGSKKGIEIVENIPLDDFYELYETTSKRNHIAIHTNEYYRKVYERIDASRQSDIFIYGATYQEILIAAIVVIHTNHNNEGGKTALYLYGASSDIHRNSMPAYALQWYAMTQAKKMGCSEYDMFGIPLYESPKHRMFGIYKFKTGFGGHHRFRLGGFEIFSRISKHKTRRAISYAFFLLVEKMRLWYYYSYKKTG